MINYRFTVNTDASLHPETGIAAWAYWIKSDHYHETASELFTAPVPHSGIAELLAIEKALLKIWQLIDDNEFLQYYGREGAISVILNTDSMFAIDALTGKLRTTKNRDLVERVSELLEGISTEFRHVKAHTRSKASRSWINRWCDRQAHGLVKKRVKELYANR